VPSHRTRRSAYPSCIGGQFRRCPSGNTVSLGVRLTRKGAFRRPASYSSFGTQPPADREDTSSSPAFLLASDSAGGRTHCVFRSRSRTVCSRGSRNLARLLSSCGASRRTIMAALGRSNSSGALHSTSSRASHQGGRRDRPVQSQRVCARRSDRPRSVGPARTIICVSSYRRGANKRILPKNGGGEGRSSPRRPGKPINSGNGRP
jgi:hypothetical protein